MEAQTPMTVLIAEDNARTRLSLRDELEGWGYRTIQAEDGNEAWEILNGDQVPQIALIDWMMPGKNGWKICGKLSKSGAQVYRILMADPAQLTEVSDRLAERVEDVLAKPIDLAVLRIRMHAAERVLGLTAGLQVRDADLVEAAEIADQMRHDYQQAIRMPSRILGNLSHEMLTPLTSILGYSELLADPGDQALDRTQALAAIHRNGELLLSRINDLLDAEKLMRGDLALEPVRFDARAFFTELYDLYLQRARDRQIELTMDIHEPLPTCLCADVNRLRQVLDLLLDNALKFTSAGRVCLDVRLKDCAPDPPALCCRVVDTGPGIATDQLQTIFKPFAKLDDDLNSGIGLGLALARGLALLMGGNLKVTSEFGRGSCFELTVDIGDCDLSEPVEGGEEQTGQSQALSGRVLLVEDDKDNRQLVDYLLTHLGLEVLSAENGRQAVDLLVNAMQSQSSVDLVLMDMRLPELDGYTATRLMREQGFDKPIIALTALSMQEEMDACMSAGCNDYLAKPIERSMLNAMLRRFLSASE